MIRYDLDSVLKRFPLTFYELGRLNLEKIIYSPTPDKEPERSIYEICRHLIAVETMLKSKEGDSDVM